MAEMSDELKALLEAEDGHSPEQMRQALYDALERRDPEQLELLAERLERHGGKRSAQNVREIAERKRRAVN